MLNYQKTGSIYTYVNVIILFLCGFSLLINLYYQDVIQENDKYRGSYQILDIQNLGQRPYYVLFFILIALTFLFSAISFIKVCVVIKANWLNLVIWVLRIISLSMLLFISLQNAMQLFDYKRILESLFVEEQKQNPYNIYITFLIVQTALMPLLLFCIFLIIWRQFRFMMILERLVPVKYKAKDMTRYFKCFSLATCISLTGYCVYNFVTFNDYQIWMAARDIIVPQSKQTLLSTPVSTLEFALSGIIQALVVYSFTRIICRSREAAYGQLSKNIGVHTFIFMLLLLSVFNRIIQLIRYQEYFYNQKTSPASLGDNFIKMYNQLENGLYLLLIMCIPITAYTIYTLMLMIRREGIKMNATNIELDQYDSEYESEDQDELEKPLKKKKKKRVVVVSSEEQEQEIQYPKIKSKQKPKPKKTKKEPKEEEQDEYIQQIKTDPKTINHSHNEQEKEKRPIPPKKQKEDVKSESEKEQQQQEAKPKPKQPKKRKIQVVKSESEEEREQQEEKPKPKKKKPTKSKTSKKDESEQEQEQEQDKDSKNKKKKKEDDGADKIVKVVGAVQKLEQKTGLCSKLCEKVFGNNDSGNEGSSSNKKEEAQKQSKGGGGGSSGGIMGGGALL